MCRTEKYPKSDNGRNQSPLSLLSTPKLFAMVRLASIEYKGQVKLAAQLIEEGGKEDGQGCSYCDLSSIATDARSFFEAGPDAVEKAKFLISSAESNGSPVKKISSKECKLLAPLDGSLVGKFICIGMNYIDHCTEQGLPVPKEPVVFSKFGSSIIGTGDPIVRDEKVTTKLDYEVEVNTLALLPLCF